MEHWKCFYLFCGHSEGSDIFFSIICNARKRLVMVMNLKAPTFLTASCYQPFVSFTTICTFKVHYPELLCAVVWTNILSLFLSSITAVNNRWIVLLSTLFVYESTGSPIHKLLLCNLRHLIYPHCFQKYQAYFSIHQRIRDCWRICILHICISTDPFAFYLS